MEAVSKTKKKGKPVKGKGTKKPQQVTPNPDEVIDISRPGSTLSVKSELFQANNGTNESQQPESSQTSVVPQATMPASNGSTTSLQKPSSSSRPMSPLASVFKSAQVAPSPVNGSQASLRSAREAWKGEELMELPQEKITAPPRATTTLQTRPTTANEISTTRSDTTVSVPKMKGNEQAYVPYLFARDTIVQIVDDMQRMKNTHVGVISQIEMNYKMIEDETQRQFNSFVLNLRKVYKDKLAVFQHVISIHRKDTDKKKEYWDVNLTNLSSQNKKLLVDKKALLVQNKLLLDRISQVREEERTLFVTEMDQLQASIASKEKQLLEEQTTHSQEKEELEAEIERLKSRPPEQTVISAPIVAAIEEQTTTKAEPEIITKETVIDMSEAERAELAAERERLNTELSAMSKQREEFDKERELFVSDRKKLSEEKNQLQKRVNESDQVVAEWKGKYDITRTQLSQFTSLRSDYDKLLAAYNATILAASNMQQADEKLEKSRADKASLDEDRKEFEKDISTWEKDFEQNNGRPPTEDDEPDSVKEFKVMLKETQYAIQKIDVEVETVEKLKRGEAPAAPALSKESEKAEILGEPVIRTVEVKIPDPDMTVKLEQSETKNDQLQADNLELNRKLDSLQTEISALKDQINELEVQVKKDEVTVSSQQEKIRSLTQKLKEGKAAAAVSTAASSGGEVADHTECEEKIEVLERRIAELEVDLAEVGESSTPMAVVATEIKDDSEQIEQLQSQIDELEETLRVEKSKHQDTIDQLELLKSQLKEVEDQRASEKELQEKMIANATASVTAQLTQRDKDLKSSQARVTELEAKLVENLPVDAAAEMKKLLKKMAVLNKEVEAKSKREAELDEKYKQTTAEKESLQKILDKEKQTNLQSQQALQAKLKAAKEEKDKDLTKLAAQWDKKEKARTAESKTKIDALNKKIKELEARPAATATTGAVAPAAKGDAKAQKQVAVLTEQLQDKKRENKDLQAKITQLQDEVKKAKSEGGTDVKEQKKQEKILKELSKKLDMETKKAERDGAKVKDLEAEIAVVIKERDSKESEVKKLKADIEQLGVSAAQALELGEKVKEMETELKHLNKETQRLTEAYQTERVQRKKYFNIIEDMKGKIRVYCRARPMSGSELDRGNFSVLQSPDEYSINVDSNRGVKEFNFDRVFMPEHSQEQVFEDTYHLVQSAVDGYNVCIFAYGQTGSGKTFTMIGDRDQKFPGIAPRAFHRIFELMEENKEKFAFKISSYMMELYNDKLLDLYGGKDSTPDDKMEIKKDKAGLVFVRGAVVKDAATEKELNGLFEDGSKNRHTAATKMNAESSRSHLILSVIIESTNKMNGQVTRGKLSLVDLAGSERVGKTGASAETLKEANSINKSLAALGDVISALSSDQQFIPYRNNKLTMLMQDSLGGNAKTLMFVNISPADYNSDETVTSLTYASRVKLITNDAQKNQDNKEIARLKAVIAKLKSGEAADDDLDD